MTETTPNVEPTTKAPSFKTIVTYILLSVFFLIFAALSYKFELFPYSTINALIALAISIVLFGILDSTAKVTFEESKIGKSVSLGGSIAGFYIIYNILIGTQEPIIDPEIKGNVTQPSEFDLQFQALSFTDVENIDDERLSYSQTEPSSSYSDHPIVPVKSIAQWRKYLIVERKFDRNGLFKGILKRVVLKEYIGDLSDVPTYKICMSKVKGKSFNRVDLKCDDGQCLAIDGSEDNVTSCDNASVVYHDFNDFSLFPRALAASVSGLGWIAPSLSTLKERHEQEKITYMSFEVKSEQLHLPMETDSYTYQIKVNDVPLYINGWQKNERVFHYNQTQPLVLEFGLQNLDFSGVHYGKEKISLEVSYFDSRTKKEIRTDYLERMLVALRKVETVTVKANNVNYEWSGIQHFGKNDGYEVFIWSTPDKNEMSRRKMFFDEENVTFGNYKVVAVARPPLGSNTDYGLVVGLQDEFGRVNFTFDERKSDEIIAWLTRDILPRKTKVKETGYAHPMIKRPNKYVIKGHYNE